MSTSSPSTRRVGVSVVVGANGAPGSVARCLAALEPQVDGDVEVIVCEATPSDETVRARFPFARFETRPGLIVPELWREGIELGSGAIVALTISPMEVAPDWLVTIRHKLGPDGAVDALGGAIDTAEGLRLVDWAEYFCRYAADMPPFPVRESLDLPGDNAAYSRDRLDDVHESWSGGFWEPEVHRALKARGATLVHDPALLVRQGRSAGFGVFVRQRLVHGREYGRQRGLRSSRLRNAVGVALSFVVPWLLLVRTTRRVFARRRHRTRFVGSLPLLFVFDVAWALGEARGHVDALRSS